VVATLSALRVPRKRAAACSLPAIALYVAFIGVSPSVLRAAVMGSLAVLAIVVDRESDAWTSLLAACAAMALIDPHVLWDIGFQLSALATAGLFAFARPLEQRLAALPVFGWSGARWMIEPLTATLAASALTLPIIVYHFGRLSLIAPLANVLILPAVPYAMLFGALATVGGMIALPLGQLLALLAWPPLEWMLAVTRGLAQVPGAYTTLPSFSVWWVWAFYAVVLVGYLWSRRGQPESPAPAIELRTESA
jgi:competence protein ComEC